MSDERRTRYHGHDVISRWSKRENAWHYTITYRWTPSTEELARIVNGTAGKSKKIRETVPADKDGRYRLESAKRLKATRDRERRAAGWVPPHIAAKLEVERKRVEAEQRAPLLYEAARDRFMAEESKDYADGGDDARTAFNQLGLFFNGRMLDEVTTVDIRDYFKLRATGTGVYENYKASKRAADVDHSFLSALYTYVQDSGFNIANPCGRPRSRKKDSPLAPYSPKHVKVTPGPDTLQMIFTATKRARPAANGAAGRELIRDEHRVLWMLCYHMAARPESEPCRLRHEDVKFLANGWASVRFAYAKNAHSNRTIPIPPEVADALQGIMLDAPSRFDKDAYAAWAATPIFRKRGSRAPWDQYSYDKAWAAARSVVEGIEGMWVRDLRATAATWMRKSGIRRSVAMEFMGHKAPSVHDEYDNVDADDLRTAAEALRPKKLASSLAAYQEAHSAHGKRVSSTSLQSKNSTHL